MSNLFNLFEEIRRFISRGESLPEYQSTYIHHLLKGGLTHNFQSLRCFEDIILGQDSAELVMLQESIENMIDSTRRNHQNDFLSLEFVSLLTKILEMIKHKRPFENEVKQQKNELLYGITTQKFNATVMLPIRQLYDDRLGNSSGECFGYVVYWALQMSKNQYCGIPADVKNGPFPYIPTRQFNHAAQCLDLNHLSRLTKTMTELQTKWDKPTEIENYFKQNHEHIKFATIFADFYTSSADVAKKLLLCAQLLDESHCGGDTFELLVGSPSSNKAHALGFCKKNNFYHFFDSNAGWFRFNHAEDFERWLPFYFYEQQYHTKYQIYYINTFSHYLHYGYHNETILKLAHHAIEFSQQQGFKYDLKVLLIKAKFLFLKDNYADIKKEYMSSAAYLNLEHAAVRDDDDLYFTKTAADKLSTTNILDVLDCSSIRQKTSQESGEIMPKIEEFRFFSSQLDKKLKLTPIAEDNSQSMKLAH